MHPSRRHTFALVLLFAGGHTAQGAEKPAASSLLAPPRAVSPAPPFGLTSSDGEGLELVELDVSGVVQRPLALTELRMIFRNPSDRVKEGRFQITLPPGGSVARFAMRIGDRWQEGEMVERRTAQRIFDDFLHRRQDPALLEQEAANEFSARVFPIPAHGQKELILSYSQELKRDEPFRVPLRGLPGIGAYSARVVVKDPRGDRTITDNRSSWVPDVDLSVTSASAGDLALRNDQYVVARITVPGDARPDEVTSLAILVDTSASRAIGFGREIELVQALVEALPSVTPVLVAAFDQDVAEIYQGPASGFAAGPLRERRALGATDLGKALTWLTGKARSRGFDRVLIVGDGVITAGEEGDSLRKSAAGLASAGVRRLDAVTVGGILDQAALVRVARAGFAREGLTISGELPPADILRRLRTSVRSGLKVEVPGASWVQPSTLDGVQPGDEVLVHAELPGASAVEVRVAGKTLLRVTPTAGEPGLVARSCAAAEVKVIEDHLATLPARDRDTAQRLGEQMITLSKTYRVSSPLTAFLVLETDADYARYGIDHPLPGAPLAADASVQAPTDYAESRSSHEHRASAAQVHREEIQASSTGMLEGLSSSSAAGDAAARSVGLSAALNEGVVSSGPDARGDAFLGIGGLSTRGNGRGRGGGASAGSEHATVSGMGSGAGAIVTGHGGGSGMVLDRAFSRDIASGEVASDEMGSVVRRHSSEMRSCYEKELRRNPSLAGTVTLDWTIGSAGEVTEASIRQSTLGNAAVESCLLSRLRRWKFPNPNGGESVAVSMPFHFTSNGSPVELTPPIAPVARVVPDPVIAVGGMMIRFGAVDGPLERSALVTAVSHAKEGLLSCFHEFDWATAPPTDSPSFEARIGVAARGEIDRAGIVPAEPAGVVSCLETKLEAIRIPVHPTEAVSATLQLSYAAEWRDYRPANVDRTGIEPWTGKFAEIMRQLRSGQVPAALQQAAGWREEAPGDVLALVALGEASEASGDQSRAARAYGSIIDLFPSRADLRRFAGSRLDRLAGRASAQLAADSYRHAVAQRPDHPSGHHLLGMALLRAGEPEKAFEAFSAGLNRGYPADRFAGVSRILAEDVGLAAAAWKRVAPGRAEEIEARRVKAHGSREDGPSLRLVLTWETDDNDVDLHIHDRHGNHASFQAKHLGSGGDLYADVTTGYGPECFTVRGNRLAYPYWVDVHYYSRGPMGYGMGKVEIVRHDGRGGLSWESRPFVVMQDQAFVELGKLDQSARRESSVRPAHAMNGVIAAPGEVAPWPHFPEYPAP